jgi:DNA polymerase (family X)
MINKEIVRLLNLASDLMEVHGENPFKIRAFRNAALAIERLEVPVAEVPESGLETLEGIGKSITAVLRDIREGGSFPALRELLGKTPPGVVELIGIKGIGPKKLSVLWKEQGIERPEQLIEACRNGRIAAIRGFGEKTQKSLLEVLEFRETARGKALYAEADETAGMLETALLEAFSGMLLSRTGDIRRKMEVVSSIDLLVGTGQPDAVLDFLDRQPGLSKNPADSGPRVWRGHIEEKKYALCLRVCTVGQFYNQLLLHTGSDVHLRQCRQGEQSLFHLAYGPSLTSEAEAYEKLGLPFVAPEFREGGWEIAAAQTASLPGLLEYGDLKGSFHNHTRYSDGKNSLLEMAQHCIGLGYQYLGISDHSQSAFYANGLDEARVRRQQEEIDQLNRELAPFRIFKGIESDILNDGSLDYSDDVLASFDFVVASVHSNLGMDRGKATGRLLEAIENPHTTFLGHPTGRLLLRREGYTIDHTAVLRACARRSVIVEINANPWRLDLDWRWIREALDLGVLLSINPDAHEIDGFRHMRYGVYVARKGGLEADRCFNTWSLERVGQYLADRKK